MREFARPFYHSKSWKTTRDAYMRAIVRTDGGGLCPPGMCEMCFDRGEIVPADIVHHRTWLSEQNINDPSITLSWDNLMRVCRDCHARIHYPDEFSQRVSFDASGRVVPIGE